MCRKGSSFSLSDGDTMFSGRRCTTTCTGRFGMFNESMKRWCGWPRSSVLLHARAHVVNCDCNCTGVEGLLLKATNHSGLTGVLIV
jgi:hypothetical protein